MAKISDTQIANRNFLAPVGFKFSLSKFPKVDFFVTQQEYLKLH